MRHSNPIQDTSLSEVNEALFTEMSSEQAAIVEGGLKIGIVKIQCINAGADTVGNDDTFMTLNGARIFGPVGMDSGQTAQIGKLFTRSGSSVRIELFDKDSGLNGGNDSMGGFTATSTKGALRRKRVSGSGSTYDVYYRAI